MQQSEKELKKWTKKEGVVFENLTPEQNTRLNYALFATEIIQKQMYKDATLNYDIHSEDMTMSAREEQNAINFRPLLDSSPSAIRFMKIFRLYEREIELLMEGITNLNLKPKRLSPEKVEAILAKLKTIIFIERDIEERHLRAQRGETDTKPKPIENIFTERWHFDEWEHNNLMAYAYNMIANSGKINLTHSTYIKLRELSGTIVLKGKNIDASREKAFEFVEKLLEKDFIQTAEELTLVIEVLKNIIKKDKYANVMENPKFNELLNPFVVKKDPKTGELKRYPATITFRMFFTELKKLEKELI